MTVEELESARAMLERTLQATDQDAFHRIVCGLPHLLRPALQRSLRTHLAHLLEESNPLDVDGHTLVVPALLSALESVVALSARLAARELPYVFGETPVDRLLQAVATGELSVADALAAAREPFVVRSLVRPYVVAATALAVYLTHSGQWRLAQTLIRLLRQAAEADDHSEDSDENLSSIETAWIEVSIRALHEVPDRRVMDDAIECGQRVLARSRDSAVTLLTLHRLGVLHFDPYAKGRDPLSWPLSLRLWNEGFTREYGAAASAIPDDVWAMPPIAHALKEAERYLRLAAAGRTGRLRALSLKALAEVLEWTLLLSPDSIDPAEISKVQSEALEGLDPVRDPTAVSSLQASLGVTSATAFDPGDLTPYQKVEVLLSAAKASDGSAPSAFNALLGAHELFGQYAISTQRRDRLAILSWQLALIYAPDSRLIESESSWIERADILRRDMRAREISSRAFVACALTLAQLSGSEDLEDEGLKLVELAIQADPDFAQEISDLVTYVMLHLFVGAGTNSNNARDYSSALDRYQMALRAALKLELTNEAAEILERVGDVIGASSNDVSKRAVPVLGHIWLECERQLGESGTLRLQELAAEIHTRLDYSDGEQAVLSWLLLQFAKGFLFSTRWANPVPGRELTHRQQALLARASEVEQELALNDDSSEYENSETALVQLSYQQVLPPTEGSSLRDRLRNLQYQFDLDQFQQKDFDAASRVVLLSIDSTKALLDEDSVLLNYFVGRTAHGRIRIQIFAVTREGVRLAHVEHALPSSVVVKNVDGQQVSLHPLAGELTRHRELIEAEPGFDAASDEGYEALNSASCMLFGEDIAGYLAELHRSGKRHLCVVPHGPLHFYPFHLMGSMDHPLAEDWIVSYLPSLAVLQTRKAGAGEGLLSVGVSEFDGLSTLVDATTEAESIARLFDTTPVLGSQATPSSVLKRMPGHRYIHLAAHGQQNALAPAFHCVFLTPNSDGESRMLAHEVERLDLQGVELVSLSACETALGRYDFGDNLRGLPSSFLRAGAKTIVGTLWPTSSPTCRTFFESFYAAIKSSKSKREAYRLAQAQTRKAHPQYRQWGAFYLLGDWR